MMLENTARNIAVVHGRFQLFHKDHLRYVLSAADKCDYLLIGITNPDSSTTTHSASNPHRSLLSANPFSYYQRMQMVQGAVLEAGLKYSDFDIIPFPICTPELLENYVPPDAIHLMSIYDDWGWEKKGKLESLGFSVEILSERTLKDKGISGPDIRAQIAANDSAWQQMVPPFVVNYLNDSGLVELIHKD